MSLTLLPITALLLLLSGMGAPSRLAAGGTESSAAMMRRVVGRYTGARSAWKLPGGQHRLRSDRAGRQNRSGPASHTASAAPHLTHRGDALPALSRAAFARKQYRTRFGFPEGAYLAQGPPAAYIRTGTRWL